ncbi:MAG TPA: SCP2 sterol-binding domain-containing protein, partial [Alphaproteobacteria bacterium]|nr:SCP2 sterol-binding domain-containing protein [Alphaproteobacteria bacterium]
GAATPNAVHNQDLACDLNIIVGLDDFKRIMAREASGLKLMLAGKMRIKGDIRIAMKMDDVLKLKD